MKHEGKLGIVWFFNEVSPILGFDEDYRRSLKRAAKDRQAHASLYAKLAYRAVTGDKLSDFSKIGY